MKEQLLKICKELIKQGYYTEWEHEEPHIRSKIIGFDEVAKEITSHVFEFIEWLRYNCEGSTKGQWWYYDVSAQAGTMFTNEEGYMFWFNNIYKK
jgi:hypothetical protein